MTRQELPASFLASMEELLGDAFCEYINSFEKKSFSGLRVNVSKVDPDRFALLSKFQLNPVPWVGNGFYYQEEHRLSKHPYYSAGLYYLQEPSAMAPASQLPVEPGDMVLDLCAAPGGKSTELGVKLKGRGMLVSNDISNSRAKALLKNIELFGIPNFCVTSESPGRLLEAFPEFFDCILVDAPCSGEGMFRKDRDMVKRWNEHGPEYYGPIQREILNQAVGMLKPGGYLLYSTCTFSPYENEDTISDILDRNPRLEVVPLSPFDGASPGVGLEGPIRLFPHRINGEGHFMALLKKRGEKRRLIRQQGIGTRLSTSQERELDSFLQLSQMSYDKERIRILNEHVYYLPEGFAPLVTLRFLRTGLLLGTMKKGRFEPSQALAMTLSADNFKERVSFPADDGRVIRYLKGETITLNGDEKEQNGWCLVCVDGFALGFAKGNKRTLKNKYYPGWRWQ